MTRTSTEQNGMARKPETPQTPSLDQVFEDDPTIPKADGTVGPPEELGEIQPMADLTKPDDFPDDVQAIIASAPKH